MAVHTNQGLTEMAIVRSSHMLAHASVSVYNYRVADHLKSEPSFT